MTQSALPDYLWILLLLAAWDLIWTGIALYKSARNGQKTWFIVFLLVNSLGIVPITYLLLERRKMKKDVEKPKPITAPAPKVVKKK